MNKSKRIHFIVSIALLILAVGTGIIAWLSLANEKLYSPFGILATTNSDPNFFMGISVYVTIGVTLFTSALIRIALSLSK
ncbi:hypothetical protein VDG1235_418 [Verrucomicrobiia bacterium DG1235]|nr:hypothetical protein VDG1235_418 [Verrucomicrobiae bacterium DG1235]